MSTEPHAALLAVEELEVRFGAGPAPGPVRGVSLTLRRGETLGLVGESGCGKTLTALSILRLLPRPGRIAAGRVLLEGEDLARLPVASLSAVRGRRIGMIFQEPMSALNPVFSCGDQVAEMFRVHEGLARRPAMERAIELLARVGIADAGERARDYPHQLSGGMRQRVMIAMALALGPDLLIADEPTTALDVTIQAQILDLLARLQAETGLGLLLITHNLGVVARLADRVAVMYAGKIVEEAETAALFAAPRHPYTRGLMQSVPRLGRRRERLAAIPGQVPAAGEMPSGCGFHPRCALASAECRATEPRLRPGGGGQAACHHAEEVARLPHPANEGGATEGATSAPSSSEVSTTGEAAGDPLYQVRGLSLAFPVRRNLLGRVTRRLHAVAGVDLTLRRGETLGLVGESGCGKTTLGRLLVRLHRPDAGTLMFEGRDLARLKGEELRRIRRNLQIVFQDPVGSLNPRLTVGDLLCEPLEVHGLARGEAARGRARELLELVGLSPDHMERYPHEFSGGQRQRIGIARALSLEPRLLVLDEPVSALDVSVQAQILNLLADIRSRLNLTYLFVAHDLAVVRHLAQRVAVMYLGQIVEVADTEELYANPLHPYTKALLASVPRLEPGSRQGPAAPLGGEAPGAAVRPTGCFFHTRCPRVEPACRTSPPDLMTAAPGHEVRCPVVLSAGAPRAF